MNFWSIITLSVALAALLASTVTAADEETVSLSYSGKKCKKLHRTCNLCEGDCEKDTDCAPGLVCYKRGRNVSNLPWNAPVPGCQGNPKEWYGKNFCTLSSGDSSLASSAAVGTETTTTKEPILKFMGQCGTYGRRKCQLCEGDCERDDHCAQGLGCFIRNSGTFSATVPVPGCGTNPPSLYAKDFCIDLAKYPCQDQLSTFVTIYGYDRDCAWINSEPERKQRRCELYGHFCRETCGYCRTRTTL